VRRQLAAGAWGATAADARQARVAIAGGAARVLIANELVGSHDLDWLAAWSAASAAGSVPASRIYFCLDSTTGLALAEAAHRRHGGPRLCALVELGYEDGRCGVRQERDALALGRAVAASEHVSLCGVETYEGLVGDSQSSPALVRVDELLGRAMTLAQDLAALVDDDEPILTAGGSSYFDRVYELLLEPCAQLGWRLCIRSGCYATHDHGLYAGLSPSGRGADAPSFTPAIEVRAAVLSRPQADKLILDCGRRDVSYDAGLPIVIEPPHAAAGLTLVALSDEHAHVVIGSGCEVAVGDVVTLGISHPCTALERWRVVPLIDRAGRVLEAMPTYF
jgi:D-serine dehydratase